MAFTNNKQIHELTDAPNLPSDAYIHVNIDQVDYRQQAYLFANGIVNENSVNAVISAYPSVVENNITVTAPMLSDSLNSTLSGLEASQVQVNEDLDKINNEVLPAVDAALNATSRIWGNTVEEVSNVFGESFNKLESHSLSLSLDQERVVREQAIAELNQKLDDLDDSTIAGVQEALNDLQADFTALEAETVTIGTEVDSLGSQVLTNIDAINASNGNITQIQTVLGDNSSGVVKQLNDLEFIVTDATTGLVGKVTVIESRLDGIDTDITANADALDALSLIVNDNDDGVIANANKITALNAQITDPEFGLAASANAIDSLEATVTSLEGQVSASAGASSKINVSVDAPIISEGVSDVFGDMENTRTLNATITRVDKVEADSTGFASAISSLQLEVEGLDGTISEAEFNIIALSDEIQGTNASITELANRVTLGDQYAIDSRLQLEAVQSDTDGLLARAYLGTDVEGYVSGIDITNSGTFSQVKIKADDFLLANSNGTPQLFYNGTEDTFDFLGTVRADKVVVGSGGFSSEVVSTLELNASQIVAGEINADQLIANSVTGRWVSADAVTADLVKAGAITGKHLLVTSQNVALNTNSAFYDLGGWKIDGTEWTDTLTNLPWVTAKSTHPDIKGWEARTAGTGSATEIESSDIVINKGKTYKLSVFAKTEGTPNAKLFVRFKDQDGNYINGNGNANEWDGDTNSYFVWKALPNSSTWNNYEQVFGKNNHVAEVAASIPNGEGVDPTTIYWYIPDNAATMTIGVSAERNSGEITRILDYYVASMVDGDLVVQGSITADNIAAKTITADEIAANTIRGDNIEANTITGENIVAGGISAREIVVDSSQYSLSKNPVLKNGDGWINLNTANGWSFVADNNSPTGYVAQATYSGSPKVFYSDKVPISTSETYKLSVYAQATSSNVGAANFFVRFFDENEAIITSDQANWNNDTGGEYPWTKPTSLSSETDFIAPDVNEYVGTNKERYQGIFGVNPLSTETSDYPVIPPNAKTCQIGIRVFNSASSGTIKISQPYLTTLLAGDLVVRGTIEGNKIKAGSIEAEQIAANTITANEIAANSITATRLRLVGDDAIDYSTVGADQTGSAAAAEQAAKNYADSNFVSSTLGDSLQQQIDGKVDTWFYDAEPTLTNAPASGWTDNATKDLHLGDLYYHTGTGQAYRFKVDGNVYSWELLQDEDIATALSDASNAQDTADSKRRVFVAQPSTPYDAGDLWYDGNSILRCKTTRSSGNYATGDWEFVKVGGWNVEANYIWSGTKQITDGQYSVAGITLDKDGAIRAKNFRIDQNGDAFFKGDMSGASGEFTQGNYKLLLNKSGFAIWYGLATATKDRDNALWYLDEFGNYSKDISRKVAFEEWTSVNTSGNTSTTNQVDISDLEILNLSLVEAEVQAFLNLDTGWTRTAISEGTITLNCRIYVENVGTVNKAIDIPYTRQTRTYFDPDQGATGANVTDYRVIINTTIPFNNLYTSFSTTLFSFKDGYARFWATDTGNVLSISGGTENLSAKLAVQSTR